MSAADIIDALRDRVGGPGYADAAFVDAQPSVVLSDVDWLTQALLALVFNARLITASTPGF